MRAVERTAPGFLVHGLRVRLADPHCRTRRTDLKFRGEFSAVVLFGLALSSGFAAAFANGSVPQYRMALLPIPVDCQSFTNLRGLDARGNAVGIVTCDDFVTFQGIVWRPDGSTLLGTFGGPSSFAYAIAPNGRVVGAAETPEPFGTEYFVSRPFAWDGGELVDLGTLGGSSGVALDVANDGTIVGACERTSDPESGAMQARACVWDRSGIRDLGTLGGDWAVAYAINASGRVAGSSSTTTPYPSGACCQERAFIHDGAAMMPLPGLGGSAELAWSINEAGDAAGFAYLPGAAGRLSYHAVIWSRGGVTDLGTLGGDISSAMDLDDKGAVVGWSRIAPPFGPSASRATLWRDGSIVDLNDLLDGADGWTLVQATSINDRGAILANAVRNGVWRVVELTPQPEARGDHGLTPRTCTPSGAP